MILAAAAILLLTGSGNAEITVDASMLTAFVRNTYPDGIKPLPSVKFKNITITSIDNHGIHGQADIQIKGKFSLHLQNKLFPLFPDRIAWNFTIPISFVCSLTVRNGKVAVPISGLSFRVGAGPTVSLSMIEAFNRWWSVFSKSHTILYFSTFDLNRLFTRYFGKANWSFSIMFSKNLMVLKAKRNTP